MLWTAMKAAFSSFRSKQDILATITVHRTYLKLPSSPGSLYIVNPHVFNSRLTVSLCFIIQYVTIQLYNHYFPTVWGHKREMRYKRRDAEAGMEEKKDSAGTSRSTVPLNLYISPLAEQTTNMCGTSSLGDIIAPAKDKVPRGFWLLLCSFTKYCRIPVSKSSTKYLFKEIAIVQYLCCISRIYSNTSND